MCVLHVAGVVVQRGVARMNTGGVVAAQPANDAAVDRQTGSRL